MRNILALIGLVVVLFLGIGYARGWYNFNFSTDTNGRVKVIGDIDSRKIKEDGGAFKESAGDAIEKFKNRGSSAEPPK